MISKLNFMIIYVNQEHRNYSYLFRSTVSLKKMNINDLKDIFRVISFATCSGKRVKKNDY